MALTYRLDKVRRVVTITGDYADASGWRALLETISKDPAFGPGFNFIRDLRESRHPVDATTVLNIITVVRHYWTILGVRRAAIVMGAREHDPALIAHALAGEHDLAVRAFISYDDAMDWLEEP